MTRMLAIEINDAGLVVASGDEVLAIEPGYAVVNGGEIITGTAAQALARVQPRQASNRHWAALSMESASAPVAGVGSAAEVAFAQLSQIWKPYQERSDAVVLVVPSHYTNEQLGLLLGLANECAIPVTAMVDAAAAASVRPYPERHLLYVDAGLHNVTVTPLEQSDEVTALATTSLETAGLATLMDAFARRIAEAFVLATRFDPFHEAATEQLLYDALPGWLEQLSAASSATLEIPYRGDSFSVEFDRRHLLAAADGFYTALRQLIAQSREGRKGLVVQISDRLARLPGIAGELGRLDDTTIVSFAAGHAARAVLASAEARTPGGEVKLFRHLPWRDAPVAPDTAATAAAVEGAPAPTAPAPTHVVYRGIAYPINGNGLVIGRSKTDERPTIVLDASLSGVSRAHCELNLIDGELRLRDLSSFGTFVNERRVTGDEVLKPADVIRVGSPGAELTAIVIDAGGAGAGNGA
jgi:hypothetical protein